jgi:hypothetical protein
MKERMSSHATSKRPLLFSGVVLGTATSARAVLVNILAKKDAMIFGSSAGNDTNMSSGMGPAMFAGADHQRQVFNVAMQKKAYTLISRIPSKAASSSIRDST